MADADHDDGAASSLAGDLRVARPAVDRAALDQALVRAERTLFGATTTARLGRFVLLGPIAGGGMGVVHGAYDPDLDRRVALKLVHPRRLDDARAHDRLLAEARALARLDHPNVVPVHDVLAIDDQIVIVMELVSGETLATWEQAQPRSWREVLAVYVQAGRGLAASHALDIVHRDFKPANAIVGKDGRVRVLDFGLARSSTTAAEESALTPVPPTTTGAAPPVPDGPGAAPPVPDAPPASATAPKLTDTGERLGTVAYMAPEQLAGGVATPAVDQFSFCVALYRALYGRPPFAGDDVASLLASTRAGAVADANGGARVPRWLRAVLVRGLAAAPGDRYPSMTALLDRIERERVRRRRRGGAAIVAAGAIAAVAGGAWLAAPPSRARCGGGDAEMARVWTPARRSDIQWRLVGIGTPYAADVDAMVLRGLDAYATAWAGTYRAACQAHDDGARSERAYDRQTACLDHRRGDLAHAIEVLTQLDRVSVNHAVDVVAGLPAPSSCADVEALLAASAPPTTLGAQARVGALRARLSEATAFDRAGRSDQALILVQDAYREAGAIGYPPATIEAALALGRVRLGRREFDAAVAALQDAQRLALETGQLPAAIEAAARLLFVQAMAGADLVGLADRIAILEPLSAPLTGDPVARALLFNNLGVVYMTRGDRASARPWFEAARDALARAQTIDVELGSVAMNLAMVTPDGGEREALAAEALQRRRDELGPHHLTTLDTLFSSGRYTLDPVVARARVAAACALIAQFHPDQVGLRSDCETYRGFLTAELGDDAAAATIYDGVAALTAVSDDDDAVYWRQLTTGYARLHRRDPAAALVAFEAILAARPSDDRRHWWDEQRAAHAHLGAGLAAHALGDDVRATAELERSIAVYARLVTINEDAEHPRRLALARTTLAAVLRARGGADARADQLAADADAFYRRAGAASYHWRLGGP